MPPEGAADADEPPLISVLNETKYFVLELPPLLLTLPEEVGFSSSSSSSSPTPSSSPSPLLVSLPASPVPDGGTVPEPGDEGSPPSFKLRAR
ncbi:MAG: hypothetical protein RBQ94_03345 [Methanimicrococcus sp.]|nr:hypothetical protein [Methanimicrococcus sp.]